MPKFFSDKAKSKVDPGVQKLPTLDEVEQQRRRLELYGLMSEDTKVAKSDTKTAAKVDQKPDEDLVTRLKKNGLM